MTTNIPDTVKILDTSERSSHTNKSNLQL